MDQTEYIDVCSQVRRHRSFYNDNDKTTLEQEQSHEIPEEIMATIEDYQGEGNARVTVSADLGSSVSYHSAKAFVSISVPVNNDADSIDAVHGMLRPYVQKLTEEDHAAMAEIRDGIINPGSAPTEAAPAAQVRQPPKRGGKGPKKELKRGGKTVTPKGSKKPNFRR